MFYKTKLENGLRLVCEKIPYVRSISVGIWVGTGSRNELPDYNGVSHFIEHMMFKGTKNRTAKEIAEAFDNIGGQLNAFTGKECTCYYAKILDTHFEAALDVLSDMFFNSSFDTKDINVERKVIMEEIRMYEDSPEELVHDILSETIWQGNSLAFPILGVEKSLKNIKRETINNYIQAQYTPENTVISVAGNFDYDRLVDLVVKYFGAWKNSKPTGYQGENPQFVPEGVKREKETEQVHLCIGFKGLKHGDDNLYTLLAVNNIFGGGMSSKLFQKIREEKGLVYSIYSYPSSYIDGGMYTIYAGMNPQHLEKVCRLISKEIKELLKKGLTMDQLSKSKEQLKSGYILGLEGTSSRMNSIGKSELMLGRINTPEEVLAKIDAINLDNVNEIIKEIFTLDSFGYSLVGSFDKEIDIKKLMA